MRIGSVKEIKNEEFRVGLTPDNVRAYVEAGHEVYIEAGAGEGSGFPDSEYEAAGAKLLANAKDVWDISEMMVKVKEPLPEEYPLFHEGLILFTYLHLAADRPQTDALINAKVKGVAYETIQAPDKSLPLLIPMSQIAGRISVQEGAKILEKSNGGRGILLGGVPGTPKGNVVILGGGNVGMNACKVALGMGANVTILDINPKRLEQLEQIFNFNINTLVSNDSNVEAAVKEADLVIGCVLMNAGASAPKVFKKKYLPKMKPGSVFVDVVIDQGGCGECSHVTYHDDPTYVVDGVIHYCVGNLPGVVPRTSTIALTNATLKFGLDIANKGLEKAAREDRMIALGINTYDGKLTCRTVADAFPDYAYTDINTLIG
ncbi:MAG: alanine dehydrogenase [Firmicutes bacterium]|nr:alanine dehydrogenase [Bacillota bacterium]